MKINNHFIKYDYYKENYKNYLNYNIEESSFL